ncbi:MAG: hypothetical protein WC519_02035 [Parcubacteria group bacterium]
MIVMFAIIVLLVAGIACLLLWVKFSQPEEPKEQATAENVMYSEWPTGPRVSIISCELAEDNNLDIYLGLADIPAGVFPQDFWLEVDGVKTEEIEWCGSWDLPNGTYVIAPQSGVIIVAFVRLDNGQVLESRTVKSP